MKNELISTKSIKNTLKDIDKEIQDEYLEKIRNKAKSLIKEIRMTEIILKKKKDELDKMLKGDHNFTEEQLLFGD